MHFWWRRSRFKLGNLPAIALGDLFLAAILFPGISANHYDHYDPSLQAPILPPLIPTGDSDSVLSTHEFSLRHIFHRETDQYSDDVHVRLDVNPDTRLSVWSEDGTETELVTVHPSLVATSSPVRINRLVDRRRSVIEDMMTSSSQSSVAAWVIDTLPGPNVTDRETVLTFAKMTANDYIQEPGSTSEWKTIHGKFNYSSSFGWKGDGLRGHIYADRVNSTVVISLKGTSPALFDGAETTTNDKVNDNLLFSCCCGQGGSYLWRQVCDCQNATYSANVTCISEAMNDQNRYYKAAIDLYTNVTKIYPGADIWLTGHSLGGALSSLLGLTFGLPVVTFEAVPEALPASRLGLPIPPGYQVHQERQNTGAYHFGHTADPVYMGTCNGINSICTWGGYAMESACHTGQMCTYDTVADKGWRVGIGTHKIQNVIRDVIEVYDDVPVCEAEEECYDCILWKFFKSNGSEITTTFTTTTTTSPTATRTSTCKTPGWWGCLDSSTTMTTTTTSITTTETTTTTTSTTCHTPGWFGCNDPTTTTTTSSATSTIP